MKQKSIMLLIIGIVLLSAFICMLAYLAAYDDFTNKTVFYAVVNGVAVLGLLIASMITFFQSGFISMTKKENSKNKKPFFTQVPDDYMPPWEGRKIDRVVIAHSSDQAKLGSAIARGAVGGAVGSAVGGLLSAGLAAPIGAAAGMMTAKRKGYLDLIIHYKNRKTETKRVKVNSGEYRRLARYIKV